MSEYQRYEFMAVDRPLTRIELEEVGSLSSHIEPALLRRLQEHHFSIPQV